MYCPVFTAMILLDMSATYYLLLAFPAVQPQNAVLSGPIDGVIWGFDSFVGLPEYLRCKQCTAIPRNSRRKKSNLENNTNKTVPRIERFRLSPSSTEISPMSQSRYARVFD